MPYDAIIRERVSSQSSLLACYILFNYKLKMDI